MSLVQDWPPTDVERFMNSAGLHPRIMWAAMREAYEDPAKNSILLRSISATDRIFVAGAWSMWTAINDGALPLPHKAAERSRSDKTP